MSCHKEARMRGYSHVGIIDQLSSLEVAGSALHYAPYVLLLSGREISACGRGKMIALDGAEAESKVVGPVMFVWGSDDQMVADLLKDGHPSVVFVGHESPGSKTKYQLDRLKRLGFSVQTVTSAKAGPVARIDCEGHRAGCFDLLIDGEWVEDKPAPSKAKPKNKKRKKDAQDGAAEE